MKKIGTINSQLSRIIASMGHTDGLVICDSGLPIPRGVEVVDLGVTTNIPRFLDVLAVVLEELQVEDALVATELLESGNGLMKDVQSALGDLTPEAVPHDEFKRRTAEAIAIVRTGEATPYANIILYSGVTFG